MIFKKYILSIKMKMTYERRLEPFFQISNYIAEFWNTISNIPFIMIGLLRLYEGTVLPEFYITMVFIGIGSGIHHATTPKWTVIIDWIPILISLCMIYYYNMIYIISFAVWFEIILAGLILYADHIHHLMPVPWGHVCWHLLASFAIDSAYQSVENHFIINGYRCLN